MSKTRYSLVPSLKVPDECLRPIAKRPLQMLSRFRADWWPKWGLPGTRFKLYTLTLVFALGTGAVRAEEVVPAMELVVLGSGGPGAVGRASSSNILLIDGTPRILIDAGSGSFVTLGKTGLSLQATDLVLLTHLHIDHVGDLAGLFKARAVSSGGPIRFDIWGPTGSKAGSKTYYPSLAKFLSLQFGAQGSYAYLRDFSAALSWRSHEVGVIPAAQPQVIRQEGDLTVLAMPGHHGDSPSVIYRVEHNHRSVTFSGDIDEKGLANLAVLAKGSDLLVFNSVVLDPPGSPDVLYTWHSSPQAIGETAAKAHVGRLLLSHLSPDTDAQRADVERSIHQSFKGPVQFAEDGLHVIP